MIGHFVTSKAGHDKDKLYVVLAEDDKYVFLSDGKNKSVEHPKKKKKKHIQFINDMVSEELLLKLQKKNKKDFMDSVNITDEEIKFQIKQYCKLV